MATPTQRLGRADEGFTAAFELVATPALFGLFGYFIDRWLGTAPVFLILLVTVVAAYEVWKLWYRYNERMDALEAERREGVRGG